VTFDKFQRTLLIDCQIDMGKPLVLGFSGGPDSLALLHALKNLRVKIIVVHFDHSLRSESAEEALRAGRIAKTYGYPFFSERGDVTTYADQQSMSVEEAARVLRYAFLFRVAQKQGAQAVAVAHNADDQAETLLMHLLRGAGSRGLRGMSPRLVPNPWSQTIPLVRPLLVIWRREIEEYCQVNGLQPLMDRTNFDTTYFRNLLRHELLPNLEGVSPGFKRRLNQTADLIGTEVELIHSLGKEAWKHCLRLRGTDYIQLDRASFLAEPLAMQRVLIHRAAEELRPGLRDLEYKAVVSALELAHQKMSTPQDWTSGLCVLTEGNRFWIADWEAELPVDWPQAPENEIHIEVPGGFDLNRGWRLELTEDGNPQAATQNQDPFQAWLDQDRVGEELILRRRQPGDRFQPLGMENGMQKLAEFMINEKLPRRARETWPLLCKGNEIVWVPGYRLGNPYRLRTDNRQALHVHLWHSDGRSR